MQSDLDAEIRRVYLIPKGIRDNNPVYFINTFLNKRLEWKINFAFYLSL